MASALISSLASYIYWLLHVMVLFCVIFPDWKHSDWQISSPLVGRLATFEGIWWRCFSPKWGLMVCDNHGSTAVFVSCKCIRSYIYVTDGKTN